MTGRYCFYSTAWRAVLIKSFSSDDIGSVYALFNINYASRTLFATLSFPIRGTREQLFCDTNSGYLLKL